MVLSRIRIGMSIGLLMLALFPAPTMSAMAESDTNVGAETQTKANAAKLDALFSALDRAADQSAADELTAQIWDAWHVTGHAERDLMIAKIRTALRRQNLPRALGLAGVLVKSAPDYAEAWNKRATVNYMVGRLDESLADIERTLALEPRHFGALSGRALVLTDKGDKAGALAAIEEAMRIHPFLRGAKRIIERNGGTWRPRQPI